MGKHKNSWRFSQPPRIESPKCTKDKLKNLGDNVSNCLKEKIESMNDIGKLIQFLKKFNNSTEERDSKIFGLILKRIIYRIVRERVSSSGSISDVSEMDVDFISQTLLSSKLINGLERERGQIWCLSYYANKGQHVKLVKLFDEIPNKATILYNNSLIKIIKRDNKGLALELLEKATDLKKLNDPREDDLIPRYEQEYIQRVKFEIKASQGDMSILPDLLKALKNKGFSVRKLRGVLREFSLIYFSKEALEKKDQDKDRFKILQFMKTIFSDSSIDIDLFGRQEMLNFHLDFLEKTGQHKDVILSITDLVENHFSDFSIWNQRDLSKLTRVLQEGFYAFERQLMSSGKKRWEAERKYIEFKKLLKSQVEKNPSAFGVKAYLNFYISMGRIDSEVDDIIVGMIKNNLKTLKGWSQEDWKGIIMLLNQMDDIYPNKAIERIEKTVIKKSWSDSIQGFIQKQKIGNQLTGKQPDKIYTKDGGKLPAQRLLKDPLLNGIENIKPEWISNSKFFQEKIIPNLGVLDERYRDILIILRKNNIDLAKNKDSFWVKKKNRIESNLVVNFQAVIARNLNFQKKPVTKENIENELRRLQNRWEKFSNISLFKDRNIIFVAHGENVKNTKTRRFGRDATIQAIRNQGGRLPKENFFRPTEKSSKQDAKRVKDEALKSLRERKRPTTFIFDGHGGPNGFYLSEGQVEGGRVKRGEEAVFISVEELFEAYKSGNPSSKNPDVFMGGACYSSNFIQTFFEFCNDEKIPKPVFYGASEYNLYSYSNYSSSYGDLGFENLLKNKKSLTVQDLLLLEFNHPTSNMTVYSDDGTGESMQLTKNNLIEGLPETNFG